MSSQPDWDVVVAGAGPAGCVCAERLAAAGHGVALVDENPGPRKDVVCTGIVGAEAFRRLDLPAGPVVDTVEAASFFSPSGHEVVYEPPDPLARVVDRSRFDAALARRAEEAGAILLRGHAAREVETTDRDVRLRAQVDGSTRELRARALVVATGHQRWLHEAAGLGTPTGYVHGVHADLPFRELERAELFFGSRIAPGFFAWAIPYGEGTARLGVLAPQGGRRLFRRFLELEPIRVRLGVALENGGREKARRALRSRGIVQGPVTPSYGRRAVAVGEAAGQVKTTTAGGIYYGMLGAETAADVLDDALRRDRLAAADLAAYEERWRGQLGDELRKGFDLQRRARELTDADIDTLFRGLKGGIADAVRSVVRFDWHRAALGVLFRHRHLWKHVRRGEARRPAAAGSRPAASDR